jgi:hypothetical protein
MESRSFPYDFFMRALIPLGVEVDMRSQIRTETRPADQLYRGAAAMTPRVEAEPTPRLEVDVIYTTPQETLDAIALAAALARKLNAQINLLALQLVPYQLELSRPPVRIEYLENRFRDLTSKAPIDTRVHIVLCRDKLQALRGALKPHSLVVMGAGRRWWPTAEKKLARGLRQDGHHVLLTRGR